MRLSIGPAYLHASSNADEFDFNASFKGWGYAFDILAGGTPAPGLVVGGGLLMQDAFEPDIEVDSIVASERFTTNNSLGVVLLGPMVDFFPNPNGGFHFGGLPGIAVLGLEDESGSLSSGLGIAAWTGYQWWTSSDFSVGGMLRFAVARSKREFTAGDTTENTQALTLMFTAVYH